MVHFQTQKSIREYVTYQTLEKVKAVPVFHSDARWNGKTETCIKIEDSFWGATFHMRRRAC
jgi:hypothetical protein